MGQKKILEFTEPVNLTSTSIKFGGQPDWIESSQWPLSSSLGRPMKFICQVPLGEVFPEHQGKVAYLFMTEEEEYADGTWEPDGGENAVIIQPGGIVAVPVEEIEVGPTKEEFGIRVIETQVEANSLDGCRLGGEPDFMQYEEFPGPKEEWAFLLQLDSCAMPFSVNFGDSGVGYAFINRAATQGKFLWQCA
jgi:uncharacterized protein YwqG